MSESITGSPMEDQSILVYIMVRSLKIVGHSMNFTYHRKRKKKSYNFTFTTLNFMVILNGRD